MYSNKILGPEDFTFVSYKREKVNFSTITWISKIKLGSRIDVSLFLRHQLPWHNREKFYACLRNLREYKKTSGYLYSRLEDIVVTSYSILKSQKR